MTLVQRIFGYNDEIIKNPRKYRFYTLKKNLILSYIVDNDLCTSEELDLIVKSETRVDSVIEAYLRTI